MSDFRLIHFDLSKAKTNENPNGLEVVTRNGLKVRIVDTNKRGGRPIVSCVEVDDKVENIFTYDADGMYDCCKKENKYDLFLKDPIKKRRMTNQELAWWLRDHPEEHREFTFDKAYANDTFSTYIYNKDMPNEEVNYFVKIRKNGGEWEEPLVEEE